MGFFFGKMCGGGCRDVVVTSAVSYLFSRKGRKKRDTNAHRLIVHHRLIVLPPKSCKNQPESINY